MKLTRLLLKAFGPFTDTEILFSGADSERSPNLHVIYGANEAGKSSALRAIADLRYGIPARSPDNFQHDYRKMRISGIFLDRDGKPIGLTRHKGRGQTLTIFDPATGKPLDDQSDIGGLELSLTGGLQRADFESMFGLTHNRLREGGELLLQGEGELGAALFEASAGTQSIAALLSSLETEAKALYNPHGRAQSAKINEARKELEEQRRRLREAQVRPAEWQALSRDYQHAKDNCAEIDQELEDARRRHLELTELRSVMPILRELDRLADEMLDHDQVPDLAEDARDRRLSAHQTLESAKSAEQSMERDRAHVEKALSELRIDAVLLEHAQAIERLHAGIEPMLSAKEVVAQEQAAIDGFEASVAQRASQIAPEAEIEKVISAIPSAADRSAIGEALSELGVARSERQGFVRQLEDLDAADRELAQEEHQVPKAATRLRVSGAIDTAQALGDTDNRIATISRQADQLAAELSRRLADIDLESVEVLKATRPLLPAQIDEATSGFRELDEETATLRHSRQTIEVEVETLSLKRSQLVAEGEMVTAETLQNARHRRDKGWSFVRRAYIANTETAEQLAEELGENKPLPEAFEHLQAEADRQGDLLRADSRRAVSFEECVAAIARLQARLKEIAKRSAEIDELRKKASEEWHATLKEHGLPPLSTVGIREWLQRRQAALEKAAELARVETERDGFINDATAAADNLASALKEAGEPSVETSMPALLSAARRWVQNADRIQQSLDEAAKSKQRNQRKRKEFESEKERLDHQISGFEALLEGWHARLFLATGASAASVKARLDELDECIRMAQQLAEAKGRRDRSRAAVDLFESRAREVAALIGRGEPTNALSFADGVMSELREAEEQEQQRRDLVRRKEEMSRRLQDAKAVQQQQETILESLRQAAGVTTDEALAKAEEMSARKRNLAVALVTQERQLAEASMLSAEVLRGRLTGLDVPALDAERERCEQAIERLKSEQQVANEKEAGARTRLEEIDLSDDAARAREAMESAIASYQTAILPWARLKLAHAVLEEAMQRFRERAQAPMVRMASEYFSMITGGRYPRLMADEEGDQPSLVAERSDGTTIGIDAMSDGTADQLYLALRLAALELQREAQPDMPLVLDDVLITSDEQRVTNILKSLARFSEGGQVLLFTHQRHLAELARNMLSDKQVMIHELAA